MATAKTGAIKVDVESNDADAPNWPRMTVDPDTSFVVSS